MPEIETEKSKTKKSKGTIVELLIVILLGITPIMIALSVFLSSLHSSSRDENYLEGVIHLDSYYILNNTGNMRLARAIEQFTTFVNLRLLYDNAEVTGNTEACAVIEGKVYFFANNAGERHINEFINKFLVEFFDTDIEEYNYFHNDSEFTDYYYQLSWYALAKGEDYMKAAHNHNRNADAYMLATVLYAMVMFLLGIAIFFTNKRVKLILFSLSFAWFAAASVYAFIIPFPFP